MLIDSFAPKPYTAEPHSIRKIVHGDTENTECTQADRLLNWLLGEKFKDGC